MKKKLLNLFLLFSLSTFAQKNYQVEVEPYTKISQSIILDYNSQIEKEVAKIYSKEEMFSLMNRMLNENSSVGKDEINILKGMLQDFIGEDYFSKAIDIMYKYYKIEIEKIDYISENKAYVKIKLGFPVDLNDINNMNMDKLFEKAEKNMEKMQDSFKKKTGKTMEEYSKSISENDEKAIKKYFKLMFETQIELMDEELARMAKNGKYIGRKEILEVNRKSGKWVIENPKFGY